MTSRTASESSFSAIAVDPLRSEKTIVTVLRTSCAGSAGASGLPQNPQRRNFAGFSSPQLGQSCICRVYGGGLQMGKPRAATASLVRVENGLPPRLTLQHAEQP